MKKVIKDRKAWLYQLACRKALCRYLLSLEFTDESYYIALKSLKEAHKKGYVKFLDRETLVTTRSGFQPETFYYGQYYSREKYSKLGFSFNVLDYILMAVYRPKYKNNAEAVIQSLYERALQKIEDDRRCYEEYKASPYFGDSVKYCKVVYQKSGKTKNSSTCRCMYCGTEFYGSFSGFAPKCPNCGASLTKTVEQVV